MTKQSSQEIMAIFEKDSIRKKRLKKYSSDKLILKYKMIISICLAGILSYVISLGIINIFSYIYRG